MSTKIWILLIVLTLLTFIVGYFKIISPLIVGLLLLSVFIKGHMISEYFMGLKDVQPKYRIIPILWLLLVVLAISFAYYFPVLG